MTGALRVAILGATSHIAKGVIAAWGNAGDRRLLLYARATERVRDFLSAIGNETAAVFPLEAFGAEQFDVVVNCIGIGDPGRLQNEVSSIFSLTEHWDSRVLECLARNPDILYINLSSGAAYGSDFSRPADDATPAVFPVNALSSSEFYGIAKLHAEARHRANPGLNIADLRVFSYFSRFIDLSTRFLVTDIVACIREGSELLTTPANIVRDYVHPDDLVHLIDLCISRRKLNDVFDVYSRQPVAKFEILEAFAASFGLKYRVTDAAVTVNATGAKDHYYSLNHRATALGYRPRYSSLQSIRLEIEKMLSASG